MIVEEIEQEILKYKEKISTRRAEGNRLQSEINGLESHIYGLESALSLLGLGEISSNKYKPSAVSYKKAHLRKGSELSSVRDILLEANEPLHIKKIAEKLGYPVGNPSLPKRVSLTASLTAKVKMGQVFTRPLPNTFGLIELSYK